MFGVRQRRPTRFACSEVVSSKCIGASAGRNSLPFRSGIVAILSIACNCFVPTPHKSEFLIYIGCLNRGTSKRRHLSLFATHLCAFTFAIPSIRRGNLLHSPKHGRV